MNQKIAQKIKKARLKMFRKDIGLMLFGACAYKFNWVVKQMPDEAEGGVLFDLTTNQVEDGNIYINQTFIEKNEYTHDNIIALIIHEVLHILQKHGHRRGNRNPKLWNFACDHVVDRDLKELSLSPYQDRFNIIQELHNESPRCTAEDAYKWLDQRVNRFSIKMPSGNGNGDNSDGDIQSFTVTDEKTGEEYEVTMTPDDNSKSSQEDKEKIKQKVEQFVSEARAQNQVMKEKNKGSSAGKIQQYLDDLLEVEIDWGELLEKAIKTNTILKPNERNWRRLHPYYQLHGLNLPGRSMEEENENVGLLILLIDTSASISKDELMKFAYVLNKSLGYFETVQLMTHDTSIHQNIEFKKEDHGKFYDFLKNQGFQGRGGTSHKECFDYIEKEIWSENEKRDVLSMVISLTDGYSDIDFIVNKYSWITNNTPLVFMSTTNWEFKDENLENISTININ